MPKNGFKSLEVGFYFRNVISNFVQNNRLEPVFASYFKGKQLQWAIHYLGTPTDNRRHYHYAIYITQSAGLVEKSTHLKIMNKRTSESIILSSHAQDYL